MTAASLALVALASLAGCGAPARAPGQPGETQILLENRVAAPCELLWVNARIDERPLGLVTIAPPGQPPARLDRPVLSPGQHSVAVTAAASCGPAGDDAPAVLQMTQPVYMGRDGGQITITVGVNAGAGLTASFAVAGGQVLAPRADGGEIDCQARQPVDRAICRTEAALARAHARRDVVLALCISDKLHEMRLLATTSSAPRGVPAAGEGALADVELDATARVVALAAEADLCIGQESVVEGGTLIEPAPLRRASAFW